jgi:hypothetical protein
MNCNLLVNDAIYGLVYGLGCLTPLSSVSITTNSCAFESRSWRGVLETTLCDTVCQ